MCYSRQVCGLEPLRQLRRQPASETGCFKPQVYTRAEVVAGREAGCKRPVRYDYPVNLHHPGLTGMVSIRAIRRDARERDEGCAAEPTYAARE